MSVRTHDFTVVNDFENERFRYFNAQSEIKILKRLYYTYITTISIGAEGKFLKYQFDLLQNETSLIISKIYGSLHT